MICNGPDLVHSCVNRLDPQLPVAEYNAISGGPTEALNSSIDRWPGVCAQCITMAVR